MAKTMSIYLSDTDVVTFTHVNNLTGASATDLFKKGLSIVADQLHSGDQKALTEAIDKLEETQNNVKSKPLKAELSAIIKELRLKNENQKS